MCLLPRRWEIQGLIIWLSLCVKAPAVDIIFTRYLDPHFWLRLAAHLGRADRSQCGAIVADSESWGATKPLHPCSARQGDPQSQNPRVKRTVRTNNTTHTHTPWHTHTCKDNHTRGRQVASNKREGETESGYQWWATRETTVSQVTTCTHTHTHTR